MRCTLCGSRIAVDDCCMGTGWHALKARQRHQMEAPTHPPPTLLAAPMHHEHRGWATHRAWPWWRSCCSRLIWKERRNDDDGAVWGATPPMLMLKHQSTLPCWCFFAARCPLRTDMMQCMNTLHPPDIHFLLSGALYAGCGRCHAVLWLCAGGNCEGRAGVHLVTVGNRDHP
jgi:hypothetical protein